jgi:Predicted permease.
MKYIYRTYLYVKGKRIRCLIYVFSLFVLILSSMLLLFYRTTSLQYQKVIEQCYPAEISILNTSIESVKKVPSDSIEDVLESSYVTDCFYSDTIVIEHKNSLIKITKSEDEIEDIELEININISKNSLFSTGQIELISGSFPSKSNPGILVDETFLDINSFTIGDEISFIEKGKRDLITIPIVGVFKYNNYVYYEEKKMKTNNHKFRMFVEMGNCEIFSIPKPYLESMTFFIDSYDNIDAALADIESRSNFSEKDFFVSNSSNIGSMQLIKSIYSINKIISIFTVVFMILGAIIFVLLLFMLFNNYCKEIEIYIAVGESRRCIFTQYFIVNLILLTSAFIISTLCIYGIMPIMSEILLDRITLPFSEGSIHMRFDEEKYVLGQFIGNSYFLDNLYFLISFYLTIFLFFMVHTYIKIKSLNSGKLKSID